MVSGNYSVTMLARMVTFTVQRAPYPPEFAQPRLSRSNSCHSPVFAPSWLEPLGPKLLHYITLFFSINFPDYVVSVYIAELVSNYFSSYVMSCVVAKHTMWASDYIAELFSNEFTGYVIHFAFPELAPN